MSSPQSADADEYPPADRYDTASGYSIGGTASWTATSK
jgi:hypothetical protein